MHQGGQRSLCVLWNPGQRILLFTSLPWGLPEPGGKLPPNCGFKSPAGSLHLYPPPPAQWFLVNPGPSGSKTPQDPA